LSRASAALIKALMLEEGYAEPPPGLIAERATAGPDAGLKGFFVELHGLRVRLAARRGARLKVGRDGSISLGGLPIARGARVVVAHTHTPSQVFINLSTRCTLGCRFCATPRVGGVEVDEEALVRVVEDRLSRGPISGVALTCGVGGSIEAHVERLCRAVRAIRRRFGGSLAIGVEPYAVARRHVEDLYSAGADEIKVNVETFNPHLFKLLCPGKSLEAIMSALEHAASIFGRNRVCSNVLIGLGEGDEEVLAGAERLAELGVVVDLRPLNVNPLIEGSLREVAPWASRPRASRLLRLAYAYKAILERHGLSTLRFRTMCLECTGCELVPQRDL